MNRLHEESSLYLLQHAGNPVHWYSWCDAALDAARQENRPILLSIGYSACHWCHVMAHESFEDEETARLMNDLFINIKVDREERPDLDRIYQLSHQLLTGRGGGWPLTVFLDPVEHIPFFAGTYFPPEPRHGMPSFRDLLSRVRQWYDQNRDEVMGQNSKLREAITAINQPLVTTDPAAEGNREVLILEAATQQLLARHDPVNGGYGGAPKFPQAPLLSAVSALGSPDSETGGALLAKSLEFTLETMARSGLRDHLDGGFFRYCVDATWTIPHFEKMLYDNAMLLPLYAEGAKRWNNPVMKEAAEGIASWLQASMCHETGGYSASIDADAGGEEGSFHVWRKDEINELLPESSRQIFCESYGLDQAPNFEGKAWHLVRRRSAGELAKASGDSEQIIEQTLKKARPVLVSAREKRVHPALDGKRLTSWNALLTEGFVRAGRALGRDDWLDSAGQIIQFIHREAWDGERLFAVYNAGEAKFEAYLDDYAWLLNAIMLFLQARWKDEYLHFATLLGDALLARFQDPEHGGFFFSDAAVEVPIARSMIFQDDATPAGNAIAVSALQKLGALTGKIQYTDAAQRCLARGMDLLGQSPLACASLLPVLQESVNPRPHIIISGTDARQCEELKQWVSTSYQVDCYLIGQAQDSLPGILSEYRSSEPVTAWVCHGMQCMPPAESREALKQQLEEASGRGHRDRTGPK
jgi:uncharacterized protein YyaL (SSP411 family)